MIKNMTINRTVLLESLKELCDYNYQRNVWLNENNPNNHVSSFTEAANNFLGDSIVRNALEEGYTIYDPQVTNALQKLIVAVESVDENRQENEIIEDPKAEVVRKEAKHALALIKRSKLQGNTVSFLDV